MVEVYQQILIVVEAAVRGGVERLGGREMESEGRRERREREITE